MDLEVPKTIFCILIKENIKQRNNNGIFFSKLMHVVVGAIFSTDCNIYMYMCRNIPDSQKHW